MRVLLIFFLAFGATGTLAQDIIYQCVLPDGRTIFQGKPCPRKFTEAEIKAAESARLRKPEKPVEASASAQVTPEAPPNPPSLQTTNTDCLCGTGKICVGERGGQFCLNNKGNKRYLAREQKVK